MIKQILDKANILTFIGLVSAVVGSCFGISGKVGLASICLILCGICDGFDGMFARKFRSKDSDARIGVELDSLADIVCSGMLPVIICISLGFTSVIDIIVYCIFIICGVNRLAYYNVNSKEDSKHFTGIPITVSCMIIPFIYIFTKCEYIYIGVLALLSVLYVCKFKVEKPNLSLKILFSLIGIIIITFIILKRIMH